MAIIKPQEMIKRPNHSPDKDVEMSASKPFQGSRDKKVIIPWFVATISGVIAGVMSIPAIPTMYGFAAFIAFYLLVSLIPRQMQVSRGNPGVLTIGGILAFFAAYGFVHSFGRNYVNQIRHYFRIFKAVDVDPPHAMFGMWMTSLCVYHLMEFAFVMFHQPHEVSLDCYLVNHSKAYTVAFLVALGEFCLESYFFPGLKAQWWLVYAGLIIAYIGDFIRVLAMHTAGRHFTHQIRMRKVQGHELITTGIYGVLRNPSYVGWFYWAVGTQMIICNPLSIIGYAVASWKFFAVRIAVEEQAMMSIFGSDYAQYMADVPSGFDTLFAIFGKKRVD